MINCYRHDVFKSVDEDATTKLIVEGISNHCSRCLNFMPEIKTIGEQINSNKHLIRCIHYVACLETLNRETTNKEE